MSKLLKFKKQATHSFIEERYGFSIPKVQVCDEHQTPYDFVWAVYSEEVRNAIALASRGSGKTRNSAIIHAMNSKFKPGCEGVQVGAIEAQSKRGYMYFKSLLEEEDVIESLLSKTSFKNGSLVEVLTGTVSGVNSPHPQKCFFDEFELSTWEVLMEFFNMAHSKPGIPAQNILTSTRKRAYGVMQRVLDMANIGIQVGDSQNLMFEIFKWCYLEVAAPCNLDCNDCKTIIKDAWPDGTPRSFYSVCKGRMKKSRGYLPWDDLVFTKFLLLDKETWEAQQECKRPEREGLVFKWLDEDVHVKDLQFQRERPLYGTFDPSGGTLPGVYLVIQEVGDEIWILDEVYKGEIAHSDFGKLIIAKEEEYKKPARRFRDPTAAAAAREFDKLGLRTIHTPTDVLGRIDKINELGRTGKIKIDPKCKHTIKEWNEYHFKNNAPAKNFHSCDAFGYYIENRKMNPAIAKSAYFNGVCYNERSRQRETTDYCDYERECKICNVFTCENRRYAYEP